MNHFVSAVLVVGLRIAGAAAAVAKSGNSNGGGQYSPQAPSNHGGSSAIANNGDGNNDPKVYLTTLTCQLASGHGCVVKRRRMHRHRFRHR